MLRTPQNVPSLTASWPNDPAQVYRLLGDIGLSFLKNLKAIYFCIKWAFQKDFFFKSCTISVLTSFQAVLGFYLFICQLYLLRGRKAMTRYKCNKNILFVIWFRNLNVFPPNCSSSTIFWDFSLASSLVMFNLISTSFALIAVLIVEESRVLFSLLKQFSFSNCKKVALDA